MKSGNCVKTKPNIEVEEEGLVIVLMHYKKKLFRDQSLATKWNSH